MIEPGQGHDIRPLPHAVQPQRVDAPIGRALDLQPAPSHHRPSIRKTLSTGRSIPFVARTRKPAKYGWSSNSKAQVSKPSR